MLAASCFFFRHFFPPSHIHNAVLVPRDDDFGAARQGFTVFASCAAGLPCALLRENDLSGAAGANRATDAAQHADSFIVRRINSTSCFSNTLAKNQKTHRAGKSSDNSQS